MVHPVGESVHCEVCVARSGRGGEAGELYDVGTARHVDGRGLLRQQAERTESDVEHLGADPDAFSRGGRRDHRRHRRRLSV
jgi:hypothetical protein